MTLRTSPGRFSAVTLALILTATIASSFVIAAAWESSAPKNLAMRLWTGGAILFGQQGADSWGPMEAAYRAARAVPRVNIYEEVVRNADGRRFQYSTASLIPLRIWEAVSDRFPGLSIRTIFLWLSWVSLLLLTASVAFLGSGLSPPGTPTEKGILVLALVALTLVYYPSLRGFPLGQMQLMLNAGIAAVFVLWYLEREAAAGAVVALLSLCKPQYGFLLLWGLASGRYRFAAGIAATAAICVLWSAWIFGAMAYVDYARFLLDATHGSAFWANQSANGFFNRALNPASWYLVDSINFAPADWRVSFISAASSFALIGFCLARAWRPKARPGLADLGIPLLTLTIASPMAWDHHYGFLPVLFVVAFLTVRSPLLLAATVAAYLLTADLWLPPDGATFVDNLFVSGIWFGAMLFLGLLYRISSAGDLRARTSE